MKGLYIGCVLGLIGLIIGETFGFLGIIENTKPEAALFSELGAMSAALGIVAGIMATIVFTGIRVIKRSSRE